MLTGVIIIDENSNVVDGDQLMALVAQSWKERETPDR